MSAYTKIENSQTCVFYAKPDYVKLCLFNETTKTMKKIEDLLEALRVEPLIVSGQMEEGFHADKVVKLADHFLGQEIYGWRLEEPITKKNTLQNVLLLGACQRGDKSFVYFTNLRKTKEIGMGLLINLQPSSTDERIYRMSFDRFNKLIYYYRPALREFPQNYGANLPNVAPNLTLEEEGFMQKLHNLSVIFDNLDKVKSLGQEIFDFFKAKNSDSSEGKRALERIADSLLFEPYDDELFKKIVEARWVGVGDEQWKWVKRELIQDWV